MMILQLTMILRSSNLMLQVNYLTFCLLDKNKRAKQHSQALININDIISVDISPDHITPVCLPTFGQSFNGDRATVAGEHYFKKG